MSMRPPPTQALKLSKSLQAFENGISKFKKEDAKNHNRVSNDVEVFKESLGPQKEKQEEEPEPEPEAETEDKAEEPPEDAADNEPAPEEEAEAAPEAEEEANPETEREPATAPARAPEAEVEPDTEPAAPPEEPKEEEKEAANPLEPTESAAEEEKLNAEPESEMPNDEPSKGEDQEQKPDQQKDITTILKETVSSCFACNNSDDLKCSIKPSKQVPCPKVNEGDEGKHNGCYTLYQVDTNITMRGCVDELAEDGLKYCLTHEKLCKVCYSNGCNWRVAPSSATKLHLNVYAALLFATSSIIIKKFAICITNINKA